jgi:hypothetical protein
MENIKRIPADDWADQDLLTRAEAGERLDAEIEAVTSQLAELGRADPDPAQRAGTELMTRRLAAMKAARAELRSS